MTRPKISDYPDLRVYAIAADEYIIKQENHIKELTEALQGIVNTKIMISARSGKTELHNALVKGLKAIEKSTL